MSSDQEENGRCGSGDGKASGDRPSDPGELDCRPWSEDPLAPEVVLDAAAALTPAYLGRVSWSWSSVVELRTFFFLDWHEGRWMLWHRFFDHWHGRGIQWHVAAWAPHAPVHPAVAATGLLIRAFETDLRHFCLPKYGSPSPSRHFGQRQWAAVQAAIPVWEKEVRPVTSPAARIPGQVGWRCSSMWSGAFVLCLACGDEGRMRRGKRSSNSPILVEDIRPHPQTCRRCREPLVEPVLPGLPEWRSHPSWRERLGT